MHPAVLAPLLLLRQVDGMFSELSLRCRSYTSRAPNHHILEPHNVARAAQTVPGILVVQGAQANTIQDWLIVVGAFLGFLFLLSMLVV
jgi:hypothetical protein